MAIVPAIPSALRERLQVAAIDFGTTYSGYALSFRADFLQDPLKIITNQWDNKKNVSLKTPSCILFTPEKQFHSFGFEAEDKYAELAADDEHHEWFYFRHFKMLLYENMNLTRAASLRDDKQKEMPAMEVFSEGIRFLKDHLLNQCKKKKFGLNADEIHWVLTVPAIWDDAAKQFMREAAIDAGICTNQLSLALEPEAASLFCKYLPVAKIQGVEGLEVSAFSPGTRYLVLDAGGGTVDITVHETQPDHTVRELYKANGGPWGGTKIDEAFQEFLEDIAGRDTMEVFMLGHKDDYLDIFREFEVKKSLIAPGLDQKITFKMPLTLHETFNELNGQDFRQSLMMKQDLQGNITFAGDKLRAKPEQIKQLFKPTCDKIVEHLHEIFGQSAVSGTDTILMVGGFSESKMLQAAVREAFPDKRVIVPMEAGLSVLKGAVIFGHNPTAIATRVSKHTYGIATYTRFIEGVHPQSRMEIIDGKKKCDWWFDKHVVCEQEVPAGKVFAERGYSPGSRKSTSIGFKVYRTEDKDPQFVDDPGCCKIGEKNVDLSHIPNPDDRGVKVKFIYGKTEFNVEMTVTKTGDVFTLPINFLGDATKPDTHTKH